MKTAVIYQSKYGSTKTYAQWIAADLGADLLQVKQISPAVLQQNNAIVYGGGLYAGGVSGIGQLAKNFESIRDKELFLFAVGASDMTDSANVKAIRDNLQKALPADMWKMAHVYCLRGGMLYSKMSLPHRMMMNMMIKMLRKKSESELRSDEKAMLETYGQDSDFTDRETIVPLVADVRTALGTRQR